MADDDSPVCFMGFFLQGNTFLQVGGNGFFKKQMVALFQGPQGLRRMLLILGGNDHDIREFWLIQQFIGAGKALGFRNLVFRLKKL